MSARCSSRSSELLSVKNINVYYGSIHAIKDVSFHVDEGELEGFSADLATAPQIGFWETSVISPTPEQVEEFKQFVEAKG